MRAADALVYKEACWLRAEGVRAYDLMGIDSARVPELAGVREFNARGPVEVPGAWDLPVRPHAYAVLARVLGLKHDTGRVLAAARDRIDR